MSKSVAFITNYMNHHQLEFSLAMYRLTEGNYVFIATTPVPLERLNMGYYDMNKQYPFILTTYDSAENKVRALEIVEQCDFVIYGSAPEEYIEKRLIDNKTVFRYSERLYKNGYFYLFDPRRIKMLWNHYTHYRNKRAYLLCASAYAAADYALNGAYLKKAFKWGYFPLVKQQDLEKLFEHKAENRKPLILWAGRFLKLKHPEACIFVAERLKAKNIDFDMTLIGTGEMEKTLHRLINEKNLQDHVFMAGAMSPDKVREYMEKADIYLFTSDYGEGWGAVLNESMNSGCAVIASDAIGSTRFLIQNEEDGMIYRNGSLDDLLKKTEFLIKNKEVRVNMGKEAYKKMFSTWNANVAAERLLTLYECLEEGRPSCFTDGPCSPAELYFGGLLFRRNI